jgi:hypothetical protein
MFIPGVFVARIAWAEELVWDPTIFSEARAFIVSGGATLLAVMALIMGISIVVGLIRG